MAHGGATSRSDMQMSDTSEDDDDEMQIVTPLQPTVSEISPSRKRPKYKHNIVADDNNNDNSATTTCLWPSSCVRINRQCRSTSTRLQRIHGKH